MGKCTGISFVDSIATQGELANDIGTPLAELSGADGVDTITHGDDGIEVIEQRVTPPPSHLPVELPRFSR